MKKYFLVPVLFLVSSAFAQVDLPAGDDKALGPCQKDIATLCAGVEHGKGGVRECLKTNADKLSEECKTKIEEKKEKIKEKIKDMHETCKAEIEKFCADVKKGKGRILKCLKENKDKEGFGAECKSELESLKKHKKKWKD
jgi:hypothetical protein